VRGIPVSGTVVGPEGRGVAGAYVVVQDDSDWEPTTTDASGAFSVAVPKPGRYRARVVLHDLTSKNQARAVDLDIEPRGRSDVVLQLQMTYRGMLTGVVVDGSGLPVAGARVSAGEHELRPVVTDAHGRFSFHVGMMARPWRQEVRRVFFVAHHGTLASAFTPVEIRDRDQNHQLTLEIGRAGIAGVVVDIDGAPVPGADVWLNFCCGKHQLIVGRHIDADGEGRFVVDVPRGDFVLSVRRTHDDDFDDRDDRVVSGGSHDVRLVVP
jgi:hypothetical protein